MANPYRKLFNLFAFSLLAFAIYLNFFSSDDVQIVVPKNSAAISQATASAQGKPAQTPENNKPSLVKAEKKN